MATSGSISSPVKKRIAILGAGPVGLEAALLATDRGHPVIIFERGEVADSVRRWGHLRMFTPFAMNVSFRGIERLRRAGKVLPEPEALLTATEYVAQYLVPLADSLGEAVRTKSQAICVGRGDLMRHELAGDPQRAEAPFRILLQRGERQWYEEAELVFDCTGTFLTPNHLGEGGIPALGEVAAKASITYGVGDILGRLRWMFENRRILVVGSGYSAATAIRDLSLLRKSAPDTSITWLTRGSASGPCPRIPDDPLLERDAVAEAANHLSTSKQVDFRHDCTVTGVRSVGPRLEVALSSCAGRETVIVDRIVAAVGFRPDLDLTRELQLNPPGLRETLVGGINAAGEWGVDNGEEVRWAGGIEALRQPEPGFFVLGAKSFGREGGFFIRDGRDQVEVVFQALETAEASGRSLQV